LGGDDTLSGGDGNDDLNGGAGNDVMTGGKGDDIYFVDSATDKVSEAANQGFDTVESSIGSFTLGANFEQLLLGSGALNGTGNSANNEIRGNNADNKLDGGAGNDDLDGDDGADTLIGGTGNDRLDGGTGKDAMTGGTGNDVYIVDDAGDSATELANAGVDRVESSIGFALGLNLENLTLVGAGGISGTGNDLANILIGNTGQNALSGLKGNDTLDGGVGKDTLTGGLGNDIYIVDNVGDVVVEVAGEGKDTVKSSVDFTIAANQEIETLILSAVGGALSGTGNDLANTITIAGGIEASLSGNGGNDTLTGGAGDDVLEGGDGNDALTGGDGNDIIDGGAGNDTMIGGKGDDEYDVQAAGDKITELANQGRDIVFSTLTSFTLGANLEDLNLDGAALNGTGNTLNNEIIGNQLDNKLDGAAGNDLVIGGDGLDTVLGGAGNDELSGDDGADTLKGGTGNDILDGGDGADIMFGEAGNDVFRYEIETAGQLATVGGDTINGFQTGLDKIDIGDLLDQFGVNEADAFADGFVLLTKQGADTLVQFDSDGAGVFGAQPLTLATVTNATVAEADIILA
jgi:Ca2+-binding RTX toxin-like protein